jgi:hypothetical protein
MTRRRLVSGSVCDRVNYLASDDAVCAAYDALPVQDPKDLCHNRPEVIPRILHTVGKSAAPTFNENGIFSGNPTFKIRHHNDASAYEYVRARCGEEAGHAYKCLAPAAFRADLFRFCAMVADGGVYLDEDIVPLMYLEELYAPCAQSTVGHDWPPGKQMKIIASVPNASLFRCALDKIISNVRQRVYPVDPLSLTGPLMLQTCYAASDTSDVAITYSDTRQAVYPYTGMRRGSTIVAYEIPGSMRSRESYSDMVHDHQVYSSSCVL